jgi:hypothetical protein
VSSRSHGDQDDKLRVTNKSSDSRQSPNSMPSISCHGCSTSNELLCRMHGKSWRLTAGVTNRVMCRTSSCAPPPLWRRRWCTRAGASAWTRPGFHYRCHQACTAIVKIKGVQLEHRDCNDPEVPQVPIAGPRKLELKLKLWLQQTTFETYAILRCQCLWTFSVLSSVNRAVAQACTTDLGNVPCLLGGQGLSVDFTLGPSEYC